MVQGEIAFIAILKYFLAAAFIIILAATVWLGWQNRASEKVVLTLLPALAIGATGALVTILFSLRAETRKLDFPAVFIFDKNSWMPLEAIDRSYVSGNPNQFSVVHIAQEMTKEHHSLRDDKTVEKGDDLYFDILLRMVFDVLFRLYIHNWDAKISHFDLPHGTESRWGPQEDAPHPEFVTWDEIKKWIPDTRVLDVNVGHFTKMAVPYGTKLNVNTDYTKETKSPFRRKLTLKNSFVTLSISISKASGVVGVGSFSRLLGYSDDISNRFWTSTYLIELAADFNPLRSGHPDMPRYRRWVDALFEELQKNFDARKHWERSRDWYLLFQDKTKQPSLAKEEPNG